MIIGTLINCGAVIAGGSIGLLLKGKTSKKLSESIIRAIGLCVCVIGVSGSLKGDFMLLVISLALGALTGELIDIDKRLNSLGIWLKKKIKRGGDNSDFSDGFVAATLLFCVGAMSIVGSIESGLGNDRSIIFTKSILDGVSAMVFASTFGFGVLFSVVIILVYQGGIEFFAGELQSVLSDGLITQISAVGSVMILAIGLNMTLNAKIKTANLLPGLLFGAVYYLFFG